MIFIYFFGCTTWDLSSPIRDQTDALAVPQPEAKSVLPAVEAWSLNHWTAREVLRFSSF